MNTFNNIGAYQEISETKYVHCQASLERNICSSGHSHTAGQKEVFPRSGLQGLLSCSCKTQYSYEPYTHSYDCSVPKPGVTKLLVSFVQLGTTPTGPRGMETLHQAQKASHLSPM